MAFSVINSAASERGTTARAIFYNALDNMSSSYDADNNFLLASFEQSTVACRIYLDYVSGAKTKENAKRALHAILTDHSKDPREATVIATKIILYCMNNNIDASKLITGGVGDEGTQAIDACKKFVFKDKESSEVL